MIKNQNNNNVVAYERYIKAALAAKINRLMEEELNEKRGQRNN